MSEVVCIGKGFREDGCDYVGGKSGGVCPACGGMLLSETAVQQAALIAEQWNNEKGGDE